MGMSSESSLCCGCGGEAARFSDFCPSCRKKGLAFCRECGEVVTVRERESQAVRCACEAER